LRGIAGQFGLGPAQPGLLERLLGGGAAGFGQAARGLSPQVQDRAADGGYQ